MAAAKFGRQGVSSNGIGLLSEGGAVSFVLAEAARKFCMLKRNFFKIYRGNSHIQEIVPRGAYEGIDTSFVHRLAEANPIYRDGYDMTVSGVRCAVYEGDISQYCIDSMKNTGSAQPFYPTWFFSAYLLALAVKKSGCSQVIDVGSGDGRIALCGLDLGMRICSIELDRPLASLQEEVANKVGASLDVRCADAMAFDYASLGFESPAVFTGGLPQMGDLLADAVVRAVPGAPRARFVLAGSRSRPGHGGAADRYGWGQLMDRLGLDSRWVLSLPTVWTFDQRRETPYICASRLTQR